MDPHTLFFLELNLRLLLFPPKNSKDMLSSSFEFLIAQSSRVTNVIKVNRAVTLHPLRWNFWFIEDSTLAVVEQLDN